MPRRAKTGRAARRTSDDGWRGVGTSAGAVAARLYDLKTYTVCAHKDRLHLILIIMFLKILSANFCASKRVLLGVD